MPVQAHFPRLKIIIKGVRLSEKYHVYRFMEFDNDVKIIFDYCEGELLYKYVNREDITKDQICGLIMDLASLLDNYREARKKGPYEGINPYSVLITKKEEVLLLNMKEESNAFVNKKMQNNSMKENFHKAYNKVCVESGIDEDMFTFAVTVGYIMTTVTDKVKFTKRDQKRLMNVISRCIGEKRKIYADFKVIGTDLKKCLDEDYKRVQKKTTAAITMLVLLLVILSFVSAFF